MDTLVLLLLLLAVVLFVVDAFTAVSPRVNLTCLGLGAFAGAFLVQHIS